MKRESKPFVEMAIIIGVGFAYLLCAQGGLLLATVQQNASPVWPAAGIALAAVFRFGRKAVIGIWLGAFFANFFTPSPFLASVGIASGNAIEAVVAVFLLRRLLSVETEWRFLLRACAYPLAAAVAASLSATIGPLSLLASGVVTASELPQVFATWWIGDALGILVFSPLLLIYKRKYSIGWLRHAKTPELILFTLCAAGLIGTLFFTKTITAELFLIFPLILWASTRFGTLVVRILVVVTALAAVIGTVRGFGPFYQGRLNENLIALQLFIAALTVTAIALGELRDLA
ncbi:MAG: MASE1 domain-containing protein, partial [Bdellovibrionota bacterium]